MCAASKAGRTLPLVMAHCLPYASVTATLNAPCPSRGAIRVGVPKRVCSVEAKPAAFVVAQSFAVSNNCSHNARPSALPVEYLCRRWILVDQDSGRSNQRCGGKKTG